MKELKTLSLPRQYSKSACQYRLCFKDYGLLMHIMRIMSICLSVNLITGTSEYTSSTSNRVKTRSSSLLEFFLFTMLIRNCTVTKV